MRLINEKIKTYLKAPHITLIGVAIFISAWGMHYLNSKSSIINDHIGIFYTKYSYPIGDGRIGIEGTTQHFSNGGYNFIGKMEVQIEVDNETTILDYMVTTSGDWTSSTDKILYRIIKPNLQPSGFKSTNKIFQEFPDIDIEKLWIEKASPDLAESINMGSVSEFVILNEGKEGISTKTRDPDGKWYDVFMRKVDKPFSLMPYVSQR